MTRPRIGELRQRVTLQQPNDVPDGAGGFTRSWSDLASVWARIEPLSGAERLRAVQLESAVSHRVTLRYREGVSASLRLKFGARVFNIRAVINLEERKDYLDLLCEEGAGA
jgi:SPP1 family predicted phage head-tail adaptor